MIIEPQVPATIERYIGDSFEGDALFLPKEKIMIAPIKFSERSLKSSIRPDVEPSQTRARELVGHIIRLMIPAEIGVKIGDVIEVNIPSVDLRLRVQSFWPRFSVDGRLDHIETEMEVWGA